MKLETDIKISYVLFYGGLISLVSWILTLMIIGMFFAPVTDPYLGIGFLFWGMISASAVLTEVGNFGGDRFVGRRL